MPSKIIPINNLPQFGVVKDPPTVGLAPNIFTKCKEYKISRYSCMENER